VSVFFAYWMAIELRPGFGANPRLLLNTLLFQDFSLNAPLWSAIVEIWCSLFFPFLYSLNSRLSRTFQFLLLLPLALIIYLPFLEATNFLRYIVFFQLGILVGKYGEFSIDRIKKPRLIFLFFAALFVYGVTPQLWAFDTYFFNYPDQKNFLIFEMPACYFLLSYVISGKNELLSRLLALSTVRYIGKISFSLYVLHYIVMNCFWPVYAQSPKLVFLWPHKILFQVIFFLSSTLVSVPLAMFAFRYIELPFNSFGRKIGRQISDWLNQLAPERVASSRHCDSVQGKPPANLG
jgi:peptidoglycan/LPS O-acetylase OafA/YrhL